MNLRSDPILTTRRLYKSVLLTTLKKAESLFQQRDNSQCVHLLKQAIPLTRLALDYVDTLMLYKLVADVEFLSKNFDEALNVCHVVNYITQSNSDQNWINAEMELTLTKLRIGCLKTACLCLMRKQKYTEAILSLKLCFEHCLRVNDEEGEGFVYEQMSYCYFYLGKMKKAEYFNTRFRMGVLEDKDS